jgi:hypothetical protein
VVSELSPLSYFILRLRNGKFTADLFNRYQKNEQALLLALMEMVVNEVSTRNLNNSPMNFVVLILSFIKILTLLLQHEIQGFKDALCQ